MTFPVEGSTRFVEERGSETHCVGVFAGESMNKCIIIAGMGYEIQIVDVSSRGSVSAPVSSIPMHFLCWKIMKLV